MTERLNIVTDIMENGKQVGQILVSNLEGEVEGFEIIGIEGKDIRTKTIPSKGETLNIYNSLADHLQREGYDLVHKKLKGYSEGYHLQ